MVEVAISLAIIGIALVAIIGVLPLGMNVQRDNREGTVINQDATVFINAISQGARGLNDLTNYIYAITNYQTHYIAGVAQLPVNVWGYNYFGSSTTPSLPLNNGTNIIGILSTPQYTDDSGNPTSGNPTNELFLFSSLGGYSNHVVAYVRSMSGSAGEKPPQDNQIIQQDAFGYRLLCVNAALPVDTNIISLPAQPAYGKQLGANLHELRLTFFWPVLPNGGIGKGRQTYRTLVAGQILQTNYFGQMLYFFQPQFVNAFAN
jgi:type II secretory pathway pseudopilin PulG